MSLKLIQRPRDVIVLLWEEFVVRHLPDGVLGECFAWEEIEQALEVSGTF